MCLPTTVFFSKLQAHASSPQHLPQLRTASLETPDHTLLTCSRPPTPTPTCKVWAQLCDSYRDHKLGIASGLTLVAVDWHALLCQKGMLKGLADSVLTARGAGDRCLCWAQRDEGFGTVPNQRSWRLHAVLSLPESTDTTSGLTLRRPISKGEEGRSLGAEKGFSLGKLSPRESEPLCREDLFQRRRTTLTRCPGSWRLQVELRFNEDAQACEIEQPLRQELAWGWKR